MFDRETEKGYLCGYDYYSFKVLAKDKCDALYMAQTEMSDHYDIMGYHIEPETAYYDLS